MSVRRLAPKELQPANFAFTPENLAWAREQIAKYPEGRQASAVIAILWRGEGQHKGWGSGTGPPAGAGLVGRPSLPGAGGASSLSIFPAAPCGPDARLRG